MDQRAVFTIPCYLMGAMLSISLNMFYSYLSFACSLYISILFPFNNDIYAAYYQIFLTYWNRSKLACIDRFAESTDGSQRCQVQFSAFDVTIRCLYNDFFPYKFTFVYVSTSHKDTTTCKDKNTDNNFVNVEYQTLTWCVVDAFFNCKKWML